LKTLFAIALFFLVIGAVGWMRVRVDREYAEALDAYLPEGFPRSLRQAQNWYDDQRPDNNAGARYLEAFRAITPETPNAWDHIHYLNAIEPGRGDAWTEAELEAIDAVIATYAGALRELVALADLEEAWLPVDFNEDVLFGLAELDARRTMNMLRLASHRAAVAGNAQQVVDYLRAMVHVARALRNTPLLNPVLHSLHYYTLAVSAFCRTTAHVRFDEAQLRALVVIFSGDNEVPYMERMVTMQCMLTALEHNQAVLREHRPRVGAVADAVGVLDRRAATVLEASFALNELVTMPIERAVESYPEVVGRVRETYEDNNLPAPVHGIIQARAEKVAHERAAKIVIALIAYEGAFGRLPEDFLELAESPLPYFRTDDPYSYGESFHYRVSTDGRSAVVYSVGPDGEDDDGISPTPNGAGDMVFRVGPIPEKNAAPQPRG
jgi:hypothetical protein